MTDNEIIKALECCNIGRCDGCPYYGREDVANCLEQNGIDLLDLINRQKAEKEALIAGQETLQKYIAEQKAEIERLVEHTKEGIDLAKQLPETLKLAQAEAIKYFAEMLKDKLGNTDLAIRFIDNLVKEMVGDDNEKV